jgi:hypothetical protein
MCAVDFWMDLIIGCAVFVPPALCCRCKFLPVFSLPVFRSPRNLCLAIYYRAALVSSAPWLWPVSKGVCCRSRQVFSPAVHPHVDRATVFLLWISNRIIFRLAGSVFFYIIFGRSAHGSCWGIFVAALESCSTRFLACSDFRSVHLHEVLVLSFFFLLPIFLPVVRAPG